MYVFFLSELHISSPQRGLLALLLACQHCLTFFVRVKLRKSIFSFAFRALRTERAADADDADADADRVTTGARVGTRTSFDRSQLQQQAHASMP